MEIWRWSRWLEQSARAQVGVALALLGLALAARLYAASPVLGSSLALGPDADDWALATTAWCAGQPDALPPHRFPGVVVAACELGRGAALPPLQALLWLNLVASALTALGAAALASRFVGSAGVIATGVLVALTPPMVASGALTTAYPALGCGFVWCAAGLAGAGGRGAPLLAGVGALVACSVVNQGLLCVAALGAAALPLMGWRALAGAGVGAGVAMAWVAQVHPTANSLSWMLAETSRYLSGNVEEETARITGGYLDAWVLWAGLAFDGGASAAIKGIGLVLVGLVAGLVAPWDRTVEAQTGELPEDDPPPEQVWQARRVAVFLTLLLAPAGVLVALMGSPHHLDHLRPAAMGVAVMGAGRVLPGIMGLRWALLVLLLAGYGATGPADARQRVVARAEQAQVERAVGELLSQRVGTPGLILIPEGEPMEIVGALWRSAWALPQGLSLWNITPEDRPGGHWQAPPLAQTLGNGGRVVVACAAPASGWRTRTHTFVAVGQAWPFQVPGVPGAIYLTEVEVTANSLLTPAGPTPPAVDAP